jgi:hypothetical protein
MRHPLPDSAPIAFISDVSFMVATRNQAKGPPRLLGWPRRDRQRQKRPAVKRRLALAPGAWRSAIALGEWYADLDCPLRDDPGIALHRLCKVHDRDSRRMGNPNQKVFFRGPTPAGAVNALESEGAVLDEGFRPIEMDFECSARRHAELKPRPGRA